MVKRLLLLGLVAFALSAQAQYQLANSDFEDGWDNVSYGDNSGVEPSNWNSFLTGTGNMKDMALGQSALASVTGLENVITKSTETRDNQISKACVQLRPYSVQPIIGSATMAQANMTNGCINLGDATADKWTGNYNYTHVGTEGQYGAFNGKPDRVHVWVKFKSTVKYGAKVSCVLHDNTNNGYMQDPYQNFTYVSNDAGTKTKTTNYTLSSSVKLANIVAHASKTDIQNSDDWQEIDIPLTYDDPQLTPCYALVTFSTSSAPGKGNSNDVMSIDDFEFIYYSELSSAKYDGNEVVFVDGAAAVDAEYDVSLLSLDKKGKGGTVEKEYDSATGLLTITVKGDDFGTNTAIGQNPSSYHTYTIQFNVPVVSPEVVSSKTYPEDLYVTITEDDISQTTEKQVANVLVETLDNGNINFVLKNFFLNGAGIGNIEVLNIEKSTDGSFAFNGEITIAEGDDPEESWFGPMIGEVSLDLTGRFIGEDHVIVYIAISIGSQVVDVHLGYARATMAVDATAQYGTFCAPYDVTIPSGVTASKVTAVDANGLLTLTDLSTTIPANTPVVLFAESGLETVEFFGVAEAGTPKEGLLTGVYEDTKITSGYVLQNLDNKVAFYLVDSEITVPANRCYLDLDNNVSGSVKALAFPDGTLTSISEIQAADEKAVIYDLSGRRVSKATKGIYIINGKKVIK